MSAVHSAHNPWIALPNLELQWSFDTLLGELVLPTTRTISNIGLRE